MVAHLLTKNVNKTFKQPFIHLFLFVVVFFNKSQWTFVCGEAAPVLVNAVSSLVQRQRFDLVLANLARLGLQSGCDVSLQGTILTFDGPHLEHDAMWMNGTSLFYYLHRMMKRQRMDNSYRRALTEFQCRRYLELESGCVSLTSVCGQEEVPIGLLRGNTWKLHLSGREQVLLLLLLVRQLAHLSITFTEADNGRVLVHIQQVYWDVTLCKTLCTALFVLMRFQRVYVAERWN